MVMQVRCLLLVITTVVLSGCSSEDNFVLYSSLNRLPESKAPDVDWTPSTASGADSASEPPAVNDDSDADVAAGTVAKSDEPSDTAKTSSEKPSSESPAKASGQMAGVAEEPADKTADEVGKQDPAASPEVGTAADSESAADAATVESREIKLLIPEKRFRREGEDDVLRVSYDDIDLLKVLNMEPVPHDAVEYFPDWLSALDGQRIRIRGFMFPHFLATGIKRFALARDNGICCFVKEPKIYDVFEVALAENEVTDYIEGKAFDVEGTFRIDPDADDTELFQLYRIENAKVLR